MTTIAKKACETQFATACLMTYLDEDGDPQGDCVAVDQDWGHGITELFFRDGSALAVSGPELHELEQDDRVRKIVADAMRGSK